MSTTILELEGAMVNRIAGRDRGDGVSRTAYQISTPTDYVVISRTTAIAIAEAILADQESSDGEVQGPRLRYHLEELP